MYSDLESAIHEILNLIDCHNRTINGVAGSNEDWTAIREDWRNVAAALVTATRFGFDRAAFEKATEALNGFQDEDQDIRHHIYHEKCLWAIYDRDFNALDDLLANWKTRKLRPSLDDAEIRGAMGSWAKQRGGRVAEQLHRLNQGDACKPKIASPTYLGNHGQPLSR